MPPASIFFFLQVKMFVLSKRNLASCVKLTRRAPRWGVFSRRQLWCWLAGAARELTNAGKANGDPGAGGVSQRRNLARAIPAQTHRPRTMPIRQQEPGSWEETPGRKETSKAGLQQEKGFEWGSRGKYRPKGQWTWKQKTERPLSTCPKEATNPIFIYPAIAGSWCLQNISQPSPLTDY